MKTYKQPAVRVKEVECMDMLASSNGPKTFSINDDDVDDSQQGTVSSDIWGRQW